MTSDQPLFAPNSGGTSYAVQVAGRVVTAITAA
jgi:hypothetical protein